MNLLKVSVEHACVLPYSLLVVRQEICCDVASTSYSCWISTYCNMDRTMARRDNYYCCVSVTRWVDCCDVASYPLFGGHLHGTLQIRWWPELRVNLANFASPLWDWYPYSSYRYEICHVHCGRRIAWFCCVFALNCSFAVWPACPTQPLTPHKNSYDSE